LQYFYGRVDLTFGFFYFSFTIPQDCGQADLNISKNIMNFKKYGKITLKGSIKNLFNKNYEYVQGYPMPGRSFFPGARYDF